MRGCVIKGWRQDGTPAHFFSTENLRSVTAKLGGSVESVSEQNANVLVGLFSTDYSYLIWNRMTDITRTGLTMNIDTLRCSGEKTLSGFILSHNALCVLPLSFKNSAVIFNPERKCILENVYDKTLIFFYFDSFILRRTPKVFLHSE